MLRGHSTLQNLPRTLGGAERAYLAVAIGLIAAFGLRQFAFSPGELGYLAQYADDFFYYVRISQNILAHGTSTFDGEIATNGYHPLWMGVLCAIGLALDPSKRPFFMALYLVSSALAVCSAVLMAKLVGRLFPSLEGVARPLAFFSLVFTFRFFTMGMEINVALVFLPLFALAVLHLNDRGPGLTDRAAILAGLAASGVILSRLDTVLFVFGACAIHFGSRLLRDRRLTVETVREVAAFALGLTPFLLYLAANQYWFGHLIPASGAAKALKTTTGFAWASLLTLRSGGASVLMHFANLGALGVAGWVLLRRRDLSSAWIFLVVAFPPGFYLMSIARSDWPFWPWYLYPSLFALPVALVTFLSALDGVSRLASLVRGRVPGAALVLTALVWAPLTVRNENTGGEGLQLAIMMRDFAATHRGVWAMGDSAGSVGYLLPDRLIQLEGLVDDGRIIDSIRQRRRLNDVLKERGVDYYVTINPTPNGACWLTTDPVESGPDSPRMSGRFCGEPLWRAPVGGGEVVVFSKEAFD